MENTHISRLVLVFLLFKFLNPICSVVNLCTNRRMMLP